jgi:hypothetical protein
MVSDMSTPTEWYRTGETRIVPWYFGLLRAEFIERRDFKDPDGEVTSYQLRYVGTGHIPDEYGSWKTSPFGFWSTMATPDDARYGERAIWKNLIKFFKAPAVRERIKD